MSELSIGRRILQVMEKASYIQKTQKSNGLKYNYVSHDAVVEKLRAHMVEAGIIVVPRITDREMRIEDVTGKYGTTTQVFYTVHMAFDFINADDISDKLTVEAVGMGIDPGDKASGKAMSYAKKYALLQAFMLATGDETDRDQDQKVGKEKSDMDAKLEEANKEIANTIASFGDEHKEAARNIWRSSSDLQARNAQLQSYLDSLEAK